MIAAYGCGLPSSIISRRVSGVELELSVLVIASEEESRSKRPGSSDLRVVLLDVTDVDHDFFDGDGGSVLESVVLNEGRSYLSVLSEQIDEIVGVSRESRDHGVEMLINSVDLLRDLALLQQDGGLVFFRGKDDSLLGDNP